MTSPTPAMGPSQTIFEPWGRAFISEDLRYRYSLTRRWADPRGGPYDRYWLSVVMLNPSTADGLTDDPTIRRCVGFAKREGYTGMGVVNLYAYRATDPKALLTCDDPVGPENDHYLSDQLAAAADDGRHVLCAWGANAKPDRVAAFLALATEVGARANLVCLGATKTGAPKHPLYIKGDQPLVPFPVPANAGLSAGGSSDG